MRGEHVYTTGEAAKICHVSQQTIIRCFDAGQLKGFRIPGSRFRRIPRAHLKKFMDEYEMPEEWQPEEWKNESSHHKSKPKEE